MRRSPRTHTKQKTVLDCALTLLGRKPYSQQGLCEELKRREYRSEEVEETVFRLNEWGYLNDRIYSITRIEKYLGENRSRLYIEHKLLEAGVSPEIVDAELGRFYPPDKEREMIHNLWERFQSKINGRKPTTKERIKWARKLLAAGFSKEEIQVCFEQEEDS